MVIPSHGGVIIGGLLLYCVGVIVVGISLCYQENNKDASPRDEKKEEQKRKEKKKEKKRKKTTFFLVRNLLIALTRLSTDDICLPVALTLRALFCCLEPSRP